jgi:hypothetical protein
VLRHGLFFRKIAADAFRFLAGARVSRSIVFGAAGATITSILPQIISGNLVGSESTLVSKDD